MKQSSQIKIQEQFPIQFYCPIGLQIMSDPVITIDGFTFERENIQHWLKMKKTNPLTRNQLKSRQLIPNRILKELINEQRTKQSRIKKSLVKKNQLNHISCLEKRLQKYNQFEQESKELEQRWKKLKGRLQVWQKSFTENLKVGNVQEKIIDGALFTGGEEYGLITYRNGDQYEGMWNRRRIPDGFGIKHVKEEKCKYYGLWKEGCLEGIGWVCDKHLILFKGHFENGVKEGYGVQYDSKEKWMRKGYWTQGLRNGMSIQIYEGQQPQKTSWHYDSRVYKPQYLDDHI